MRLQTHEPQPVVSMMASNFIEDCDVLTSETRISLYFAPSTRGGCAFWLCLLKCTRMWFWQAAEAPFYFILLFCIHVSATRVHFFHRPAIKTCCSSPSIYYIRYHSKQSLRVPEEVVLFKVHYECSFGRRRKRHFILSSCSASMYRPHAFTFSPPSIYYMRYVYRAVECLSARP